MDPQVIASMARWPDVPAVHGWLSLTEAGQWRLHPLGNALEHLTAPGEPITSPQITAFIDRNYAADSDGQWYFQNGPQRVYVRLDAAPFVLHLASDPASTATKLRTHTGLDVGSVTACYVDENGRLYLDTDRGAALLAGRDLPALLDAVMAESINEKTEGESADVGASNSGDSGFPDSAEIITQCIESGQTVYLRSAKIAGFAPHAVPLQPCTHDSVAATLGFRRLPQPQASP